MYRLKGRIQQYAWGGNHFIPDLFNIPEDRSHASAEYWLGTHPGGITEIELDEGEWESLPSVIDRNKEKWLGSTISKQFGRLPFLLKVLDVKDMLSIQVHPNKEAAEKGFLLENEKGIPLNAANRNYKDDNHKPEVMIALSEFWLLHGFAADIEARFEKYDFLKPFKSFYDQGGIKLLYKTLMELNQERVNDILAPLASSIIPLYKQGNLEKSSPDFWAARAIENLCNNGVYDKGIFSIYLFNILCLKTGEGIFQGAGMPHAYLEGQNIELMSNSDNVLRAGLTSKYIDIPELLANTQFNITVPKIIKVKQKEEKRHYDCPVPDFAIDAYHLNKGTQRSFQSDGPAILLFIKGVATIIGEKNYDAVSAVAFYSTPGEKFEILANTDLYFVVATVP
jgi:mannose-6-phosphate isomerase